MFYFAALWIAAIGVIVGATATSTTAQVTSQPGSPQARDQEERSLAEAREQAQRSLAGLRSFVTPQTFQRLGFESVDEASRARIEPPIQIFMVRLDRLREYRPGENPADVLVRTNEIRFPLSVDGQVRSSVTLRRTNGRWEVARLGRPQLTKELSDVIQRPAMATQVPREAFFEVNIPALSLDFVGRRADTRILLTPLVSEPQYELQAGETLDAGQVFERLAPFAQQLRTGPFIAD
jgi:hypothetical protein